MLTRILEPEVMDTDQDAREYNGMDHSDVNRKFVQDLLDFAGEAYRIRGRIGTTELPSADDLDPASTTETSNLPLGDVLDVGTGTALIPIELCRRHHHCRVKATDLAASMLNLAVYNLEVAGLTDRISLAQIDAKKMIFPDQYFDAIISNSIIHHIPEPFAVMQEMDRVLRPGGILFVRDLMRPDSLENLDHLVTTYAGKESDYSQKLFADSLHAALTLQEIKDFVSLLGYDPKSVIATSDRHWTWQGIKSTGQ